MNQAMLNQHVIDTHMRLQHLPRLLDMAHDFAYSPIFGKGEIDTPLSPQPGKSRPPGRFNRDGDSPSNDAKAMVAYKKACMDIARAYNDCVRIALRHDKEIPYWKAAETIIPYMTVVPSPWEVSHGCRILVLAFLRLHHSGASELAETSRSKRLIGGPALALEKAYNALERVFPNSRGSVPLADDALITQEELSEAAKQQLRRWSR